MAAIPTEVTCIIVTYNSESDIEECLDSILSQELTVDIIVYDNNSSDDTISKLNKYFDSIKIIKGDRNLGYSKACNRAFKAVSTKYVCFLNPDTVLRSDSLKGLYEFMEKNRVIAVCGPQFISSSGELKNSIAMFPTLSDQIVPKCLIRLFSRRYYRKNSFDDPSEVESLVGACFFVRSDVFRVLGGFDEDYFLFLEETDFCRRLRMLNHKGYPVSGITGQEPAIGGVFFLPELKVVHKGGRSKASHRIPSKIEYYKQLVIYFRKNNGMHKRICLFLLLPFKFLLETIVIFAVNIVTLFLVPEARRRMFEAIVLLTWSVMCYPKSWGIKRNS